jgi:DNA-binding transcriptional regulator LsrR (DeoR family)
MARSDEVRLMVRAARMYYAERMSQAAIARQLGLSQATVSRLMRRAEQEGIVRISIDAPRGTYPDLEDRIRKRYGIADVIIAECAEDREEQIIAAIGAAAAHFLTTTMQEGEVVGISSWSQTILKMVDNIHPVKRVAAARIVQTLGGMGNPGMEIHATQLTTRLARLTQAQPILLSAPGVASSTAARLVLVSENYVRATMDEFRNITLGLVGIGTVQPSELLSRSGKVFTREELEDLARMGAIGDISLRFFDAEGKPVRAPLDDRVIGITLQEVKAIPRVVGLAGGERKVPAIRGALLGGYLDTLITDHFTAEKIAKIGLPSDPQQSMGEI